jgi:hypothetical protein
MNAAGPRTFLLLFCAFLFNSAPVRSQDLAIRGQYIFATAGGCACHTVPNGTPNVGARPFPIPFGTVYSTNITQDKETGLGNWTDQQSPMRLLKGSAAMAAGFCR